MFLGVVCTCAIIERMCASMHMLMCAIEAGRATTNAACCRAYECPLWTHIAPEPQSHLRPVGLVCTYEEKRPHLQAITNKNVHVLIWPRCPVAGLGEKVNQAPTGPPSLVLDWVQSVIVENRKVTKPHYFLFLKSYQNPILLWNEMQMTWNREVIRAEYYNYTY